MRQESTRVANKCSYKLELFCLTQIHTYFTIILSKDILCYGTPHVFRLFVIAAICSYIFSEDGTFEVDGQQVIISHLLEVEQVT